jgi:hypothetical protein
MRRIGRCLRKRWICAKNLVRKRIFFFSLCLSKSRFFGPKANFDVETYFFFFFFRCCGNVFFSAHHTHLHTYTHTQYARTHLHTFVYTHVRTQHARAHTLTHTHTHTYTHVRTHTHSHVVGRHPFDFRFVSVLFRVNR